MIRVLGGPRLRASVLRAALLVAAWLVAAPSTASAQLPGAEVGGMGSWGYLGLVFNLGLVLVAIWAAVVAMRWYVRRMNGEVGGARQLQVLESRALGPNRSLHLVRLADRAVLLGVTADRINALLTVDDPAEVQRMVTAAAAGTNGSLLKMAGDVTGRAGINLPSAAWTRVAGQWWAALLRGWIGPTPRARSRLRPLMRAPQPAAPASMPARAPGATNAPSAAASAAPDVMGGAMQRANAAAAYAREASIAAAQRAIAEARAADAR